MGVKILAVDDNQVNLKVVSAALSHVGYEVITAASGVEALNITEKIKPDVILLDINMPEMDGYEVCRRMRASASTAQTPIMMLTAHDSLEEKVKVFEAGADDYLTKPFQPAELQARVKVLLRRIAAPTSLQSINKCKVIGVFSLRGGVGVSTISTNIAVGLARIWNKRVTMMDLVLGMGQSALMLNLPLRNTIADIAKMPEEEIDAELVKKTLLVHECGVSVLASPRKVEEAELVTSTMITRIINALKITEPYIILDLPHDFSESTLAGLDQVDEYIIAMAPELASVRAVSGLLDVFDHLKYDRNKVHLVMNWTFERRGLARKDIENVLKLPVHLVIPFAPETFVTAINLGIPPTISAPESPIGALFEDFAFNLSSDEDRASKPVTPSEAWLRVNERIEARQQTRK
ncbi:MAG: response regulator [Anaerolineaceae bacterium]|nr:response regulator [Anaerolineaceae bacterium]